MKKRGLIIAFLLGFIIGFAAGTWFYGYALDKPEVVIGKQKVKGKGNSVDFINKISNGKEKN